MSWTVIKNREEYLIYGYCARQVGKTTGMILQALGEAMADPGKPIVIRDYPHNRKMRFWLLNKINDLTKQLKLKNIEVSIVKLEERMDTEVVQITSHNYGVADIPDKQEKGTNRDVSKNR